MMKISKGNDTGSRSKNAKEIIDNRVMLQLVIEKHFESETKVERLEVVEVDERIS